MLRYVLLAVGLAALLPAARASDEPVWGTPVDGLRVGIKAALTDKGSPALTVVYANVSEKDILIPAAFPRQAILRLSATAVRKTAQGLSTMPLEASAFALSQDRIEAPIALAPKASFECALPPLLRCEPLVSVDARCSFRAEAPDEQPEANGWQDIAESGMLRLRRTKAGWALVCDAYNKEASRDDWASHEEIWSEFLARKPELLALLKEPDWGLCREAAGALALMGAAAADAVTDMSALLQREDPTEDGACHQEVVVALGLLARHAPAAISALTRALADPKEERRTVRLAAIKALSKLPASDDLVKAFIGALKDPWSAVRCEAAFSLGKLGPEAKEALPALQETAKDPLGVVHEAAVDAIKRIGG